jgi:hypothetical protein
MCHGIQHPWSGEAGAGIVEVNKHVVNEGNVVNVGNVGNVANVVNVGNVVNEGNGNLPRRGAEVLIINFLTFLLCLFGNEIAMYSKSPAERQLENSNTPTLKHSNT